MLARFQGRDDIAGMVGDRRVDVDRVDVGIRQHVLVAGVAFLDAERLADLVQPLGVRWQMAYMFAWGWFW